VKFPAALLDVQNSVPIPVVTCEVAKMPEAGLAIKSSAMALISALAASKLLLATGTSQDLVCLAARVWLAQQLPALVGQLKTVVSATAGLARALAAVRMLARTSAWALGSVMAILAAVHAWIPS